MNAHTKTKPEFKNQRIANAPPLHRSNEEYKVQLVNNRPECAAEKKMQHIASNSFQAKKIAQLQKVADNYVLHQFAEKKYKNDTGLPGALKSGIENLSGYSMDKVRVHHNSDKPAQFNAHAYAQGTEIHLASGQEKYLPHEAWHVVQQMQGRVKPMVQLMGKWNLNDDVDLEREADVMGSKALRVANRADEEISKTTLGNDSLAKQEIQLSTISNKSDLPIQRKPLNKNKLNVAGENHLISGLVEKYEEEYVREVTGGGYWTETTFRFNNQKQGAKKETVSLFGDPKILQVKNTIIHNVSYLKSSVELFHKILDPKLRNYVIGRSMLFNEHVISYLNGYRISYDSLKELSKEEVVERPELQETYEWNNEFGERLFGKLLPELIEWNSTILREDDNESVPDELFEKGEELHKEVMELISEILNTDSTDLSVIDNLQKKAFHNVVYDRSEAMHVAAMRSKGVRGVWKIGDLHVQDIQKYMVKKGKRMNYELMTEKEFQDGFEEWLRRKNIVLVSAQSLTGI